MDPNFQQPYKNPQPQPIQPDPLQFPANFQPSPPSQAQPFSPTTQQPGPYMTPQGFSGVSQPAYQQPYVNTPPQSQTPFVYESNPFKVSLSGLTTILKVNPMPAIFIALTFIVGFFGLFLVSALLARPVPVLSIVFGVISILLIYPLLIGAYSSLAARSIAGNSTKTGEMYADSFKKILTVASALILMCIVITLGFVLLIIPGLVFAAWFSFTFIAIFDENLGAIAAMKRSKQLAKGHVIEILGANFAGSFLGGSGLLSPAIVLAPVVGRYEQIKALQASGMPKPKIHWLNFLAPFIILLFILPLVFLSTYIKTLSTKNTETSGLLQTQQYENYNSTPTSIPIDDLLPSN